MRGGVSSGRKTRGGANQSKCQNIPFRDGDTSLVPKPGFCAVPSDTWVAERPRQIMPKTPNKKKAKFPGFVFGTFCVFSVCGVFGVSQALLSRVPTQSHGIRHALSTFVGNKLATFLSCRKCVIISLVDGQLKHDGNPSLL